MSYIFRSSLMNFTTIELLDAILEDDERANRKPFRNADHSRSIFVDNALIAACATLPEGKEKRALEYVISHPCAEFHFGGKDAVGPALRKGLDNLRKVSVKGGIEKCDAKLYRSIA